MRSATPAATSGTPAPRPPMAPTRAQRPRAAALGAQHGAVVAIDPATGAVLALVANPTFDPNVLASGDPAEGNALAADPEQPLLNRATAAAYPPGSAFK